MRRPVTDRRCLLVGCAKQPSSAYQVPAPGGERRQPGVTAGQKQSVAEAAERYKCRAQQRVGPVEVVLSKRYPAQSEIGTGKPAQVACGRVEFADPFEARSGQVEFPQVQRGLTQSIMATA